MPPRASWSASARLSRKSKYYAAGATGAREAKGQTGVSSRVCCPNFKRELVCTSINHITHKAKLAKVHLLLLLVLGVRPNNLLGRRGAARQVLFLDEVEAREARRELVGVVRADDERARWR